MKKVKHFFLFSTFYFILFCLIVCHLPIRGVTPAAVREVGTFMIKIQLSIILIDFIDVLLIKFNYLFFCFIPFFFTSFLLLFLHTYFPLDDSYL